MTAPTQATHEEGSGAARCQGRRMIIPPTNVRMLIATKPVDFRKRAMCLAAIVEAEFKADPFSGVIYVFRSKRAVLGRDRRMPSDQAP